MRDLETVSGKGACERLHAELLAGTSPAAVWTCLEGSACLFPDASAWVGQDVQVALGGMAGKPNQACVS